MTKQAFKELQEKDTFPFVFVEGMEYEIKGFEDQSIITTTGQIFPYWKVSKRFYLSDLPDRKMKAINEDILKFYIFGNERLDTLMQRLSKKYKVSEEAIKRASDQLTIQDMKNFKLEQNG